MVELRSELQNQVMNTRKNAFYQVRDHSGRGAESGVEKQPEGKATTKFCLC